MAECFHVRIQKEQLIFCSGHFISYEGDKCERLHGHNYRTAIEVEGPLDQNYYVFDFIALKQLSKTILEELDHRMMLPTRNSHIHVNQVGQAIEVRYRDREWKFPIGDCVLLPIENTTAELLARYLAGRIRDVLLQTYGFRPMRLSVEVEESPGQSAIVEWRS